MALAQTAYTSSATPIRTDRGKEYEVFSQITRRLKNADPTSNYRAHVNALHENRQLWTLLAVDVADADNRLPNQVRAQIFYLAEFTLLHTSKVLAGEANVSALVDVNTAMMRGLRQQGTPK